MTFAQLKMYVFRPCVTLGEGIRENGFSICDSATGAFNHSRCERKWEKNILYPPIPSFYTSKMATIPKASEVH